MAERRGTLSAQAVFWAALAYGALGLVYLAYKSVLNSEPEIDLKYVWSAGQLWAEGINPYTDVFSTIGDRYFEGQATNRLDNWLYPPNWWIIARPLALVDITQATFFWRTLNAALICGSVALSVAAFAGQLSLRWPVVAALSLGFGATLQAAAQALSMGQTSIPILFGLSALIFGLMRGGRAWMVLGLLLVALKPQIGLVVLAAMLMIPEGRRAALWAVIGTGILCIPAFLAVGAGATISGVIDTYLNYDGAIEVTSAANTTGLRHLIYALSEIEISSVRLTLVAAVLTLPLAWLCRYSPRDLAVLVLVMPPAFIGLHSYDFVIVTPLVAVVFVTALPLALRLVLAAGLLVIYRSSNLAELIGFSHPQSLFHPGSLLDSGAALVMLLAFVSYRVMAQRPHLVSE